VIGAQKQLNIDYQSLKWCQSWCVERCIHWSIVQIIDGWQEDETKNMKFFIKGLLYVVYHQW